MLADHPRFAGALLRANATVNAPLPVNIITVTLVLATAYRLACNRLYRAELNAYTAITA